MTAIIYEQPPWNPCASLVWRTDWHRAGWRDVLRQKAAGETVHQRHIDVCNEMLALPDDEVQAHLWPHLYRSR